MEEQSKAIEMYIVIDNVKGKVLKTFPALKDAIAYAKDKKVDVPMIITYKIDSSHNCEALSGCQY